MTTPSGRQSLRPWAPGTGTGTATSRGCKGDLVRRHQVERWGVKEKEREKTQSLVQPKYKGVDARMSRTVACVGWGPSGR